MVSLLQVLFLGLSTFAPASCAQFQLHVPSGRDRVLAVEGDEVVLPAWYTFQGEAASAQPWETLTLMWFLEQEGQDLKQVLAHINGATTSQDGASLVYPRPSRNVSLRLQGLREKDSGSYRCSVNVQDKQGTSRGHDSKTLKLDVWVPPAPPSCHLLGAPRVGTNVTLSCKSPRSKPAALYQWERLQPSVEVFFAPVLDAISGLLSLRNLSSSMSGVYICKASNRVGSASCNVTLEVSTGKMPLLLGLCPGRRAQTQSPRMGPFPLSPRHQPSDRPTALPGWVHRPPHAVLVGSHPLP
ncbi:endothelial cell-selective adhesion molecule isoform X3 [Myotis myotis]|uniref:endothelial cell-selective adhesion molecule isoform X3 n=1 Tax=Myotis myotis TaxID=51298 RepID=UPI00174CDEDB|nr:endothelial cell-selective adhesion molecule isoform X3 [Myotis myotis]